jgi:hypothetical protein
MIKAAESLEIEPILPPFIDLLFLNDFRQNYMSIKKNGGKSINRAEPVAAKKEVRHVTASR